MSYAIGQATLNLQPTPRLAHTEYCTHAALKRRVTGIPSEGPEQERAFVDAWEYDLIWHTDDGPVDWAERGRTTDMGHAEFLQGGTDRREPRPCPFASVQEALAVDAVAEFGLHPMDDLVAYYQHAYDVACHDYPNQVNMGGYYKTLISGAIALFGWEMLLEAAATPRRFARVLDTIFAQTLHHAEAWSRTSIDWFMCHDDMVWSQGPFMRPEFYRAEVFPRYRALFALLHRAGKRVIFTSDGDMRLFVDDVIEAGADVLCFEALTPLEPVVARYGQTHGIISSKVDARTLTFGTPAEIRDEVRQTIALASRCRGLVVAVGNHIPSNVPIDNALYYMDTLRSLWSRRD
ncbi:MAG: uroporphyrinogen decarboxylase family protein [Anaerolineae bacterium]